MKRKELEGIQKIQGMPDGWEEGSFNKGHIIYEKLYEVAKDLFEPFEGVSRVYENQYKYGGFWATYGTQKRSKALTMIDAHVIRERMNEYVGFSIIAKPQFLDEDDDENPYMADAILLGLVPKRIADSNEQYGGDAMTGALQRCIDAGIEIRI